MMSFSALFIAFIVTNVLWAGFSIYLNSSWKADYWDMFEMWMDLFKDVAGDADVELPDEVKDSFVPKGDEMR